MTVPVALQLYTVREALAHDFRGVIEQIATIGYVGVNQLAFPARRRPRQRRCSIG